MEDKELERIKEKKARELMRRMMGKIQSKPAIPTGIVHLSDRNFDSMVIRDDDVPVLVDFWAVWCMPCRMMEPILEELSKKYAGKVLFAKVNVDDNPRLAVRFGIHAIPTLLLFKRGQPVERIVGVTSPASLDKILAHYAS